MISGHGGNVYQLARTLGCSPAEIVDLSSNINSLGPPAGLLDYLKSKIENLTKLPEVDSRDGIRDFADWMDLDPMRILAGNGTTQFIYSIPKVFGSKRALILGPTYSDYRDACHRQRVDLTTVVASEHNGFIPNLADLEKKLRGVDTVFICNPNNPTGSLVPREKLQYLCAAHPKTAFIIDESYLLFADGGENQSLVNAELDNVFVLASISKMFTIPGLRIGFLVGSPDRIKKFEETLLPWNVNSLAQTAVGYLARHKQLVHGFIKNTQLYFQAQKTAFFKKIKPFQELKPFQSNTPFILIKLAGALTADKVCANLAKEKILVRNCENFEGLSDRFIRISLKSPELNRLIADKLAAQVQKPDADLGHPAKRRIA
jgi:threonine-phosphate decarboxylase